MSRLTLLVVAVLGACLVLAGTAYADETETPTPEPEPPVVETAVAPPPVETAVAPDVDETPPAPVEETPGPVTPRPVEPGPTTDGRALTFNAEPVSQTTLPRNWPPLEVFCRVTV